MTLVVLLACVTARPPAAVPVTPDTDAVLEYGPVTDPSCRTCCIILRDGEDPRFYEGRYPLLGVDEDDATVRFSDGYLATCAPCSCDLSTLPSEPR